LKRTGYAEQLKHPNWQRRRLECLEAARWECENCGNTEVTLHVHHKRYVKGRMAWEYSDQELIVLCESCHDIDHHLQSMMALLMVSANRSEATGLCAGFYSESDADPKVITGMSQLEPLNFHIGVCALIVSHLDIDKIAQVAEYAASLTNTRSPARAICEKWFAKFDAKKK
jgi:hypothetical protein